MQTAWLKGDIDWEKKQRNIEEKPEVEGILTNEIQVQKALVEEKEVQKQKKYQLLISLGEIYS